jgi:hypothetical protein
VRQESTTKFHSPYETMASYLAELDAAVPPGRRVLAALGDRSLRWNGGSPLPIGGSGGDS